MSQLQTLACRAITQSHDDAFNEIATKSIIRNQWENIYTAHLCRGMANIARNWKSVLATAVPRMNLSMASVFTHQTPKVKWGAKRCELADVLLVVIDRTLSAPIGIAVLVQAKLSETVSITLKSNSEKTQFDLLTTRPIFNMDSTAPAPTQIDLRGYSPDTALLYGLTSPTSAHIPSKLSAVHHWMTVDGLKSSASKYSVSGKDCLAYTLTGMLAGKLGWKFNLGNWTSIAAATPRDDWSILINYLLEKTFSKVSPPTYASAMGRHTRGQEDLLYFTATNPLGNPMFYFGHDLNNSITIRNYSRAGEVDIIDWTPASLENRFTYSGGGNSSNDGGPSKSDEFAQGGPISVVLFEIGPIG